MKKRLTLTPLTDKRMGRYMFLLCFSFYFLAYCGRLNYAAALAEITTTGFLEKDAAGLISTALYVSYGCGQFAAGFISDRLPPFGLAALGMTLSGGMNLAMFAAVELRLGLPVYIAIWALNGCVQSVIWPTMIRIVSNILPEEQRFSAGIGMLATTAVGTVLTYVISSAIMKLAGWRQCFLVPGILLLITALVWLAATRRVAAKTISYRECDVSTAAESEAENGKSPLLPLMLLSGALFMALPIGAMAIVKDGITTWTPTIITELFATKPYLSTLMTTVIPLISIFGAAFSRLVMGKWLHDEMKSSVFMFALGTVLLLLMTTVGSKSLVLMLALLALTIMCLLGINTMFISLVPLRFGKYGLAATMTGILNSTASICCGISTYLVGLLAKNTGWNVVFVIFLALCVMGAAVSALLIRRWGEFKKR